jgi:deoxyribonuclease V
MKWNLIHNFENDIQKMKEIQLSLKEKINFQDLLKEPEIVCGVDLSLIGNQGLSVITTLDFKSLKLLDVTYSVENLQIEYIPGFLAFRELPVFLKAWELLQIEPDVVFFDGHGYAHPRRLGIATHASFFIEKPTVGIGKSLLVGNYEEPGNEKGDYSYLYHINEIIGAVVRTRKNVNPVFISPGNYITLEKAIQLSLKTTTKYRLPEITRIAHNYTQSLKKELMNSITKI